MIFVRKIDLDLQSFWWKWTMIDLIEALSSGIDNDNPSKDRRIYFVDDLNSVSNILNLISKRINLLVCCNILDGRCFK